MLGGGVGWERLGGGWWVRCGRVETYRHGREVESTCGKGCGVGEVGWWVVGEVREDGDVSSRS
jgi:hypothetical protein